jgi:hypothetical protein
LLTTGCATSGRISASPSEVTNIVQPISGPQPRLFVGCRSANVIQNYFSQRYTFPRSEYRGDVNLYPWLYSSLLNLARFFSFLIFYTVGTTLWTGDQPVARPLPTHRTTQTQNKRTQIHMPRVRFEPTIPMFELAKTVHALDRAATLIVL